MTNKRSLQDVAAERAVLAGLCQYGLDVFLDIDFIDTDHFTNEMNQVLFKCIKKVISESSHVELASILSAANNLNLYENINNKNEIGFLRSLFNFPIHKDNVSLHGAKLAKLKLARNLKQTLKVCEKRLDAVSGDEDLTELISIVESPVLDATSAVYESSGTTPEIIGNDVEDYINHLADNPAEMIGISSGFSIYDQAIGGGLRRKCVDLVAARVVGGARKVHVRSLRPRRHQRQ